MPSKSYSNDMAYGTGAKKGIAPKTALFGSSQKKTVETTGAQKYDMGRMKVRPSMSRGYNKMAWEYKY